MGSPVRLSIDDLRFAYRGRGAREVVFPGLSIQFSPGKTALLGPNGAGKSTLLAFAAGVLLPGRGRVELREDRADGQLDLVPSSSRAFRRQVAWLPQRFEPLAGLTVREHAAYAAWLKGASRAEAKDRAMAALETVGLADLADRKATALSGGQRQRLGLAGALAHEARVILLDEPSAGLDPLQRERLRDLVAGLPEEVVVVVATHQTEDVGEEYTDVVVLDRGEVRFQGRRCDLLAQAVSREPSQGDPLREAYRRLVTEEA